MTEEEVFWLKVLNECTPFTDLKEENFTDNIWFDLNFSENSYRKLLMDLALKLNYSGFNTEVNYLEELIYSLQEDEHCKKYYNLNKTPV